MRRSLFVASAILFLAFMTAPAAMAAFTGYTAGMQRDGGYLQFTETYTYSNDANESFNGTLGFSVPAGAVNITFTYGDLVIEGITPVDGYYVHDFNEAGIPENETAVFVMSYRIEDELPVQEGFPFYVWLLAGVFGGGILGVVFTVYGGGHKKGAQKQETDAVSYAADSDSALKFRKSLLMESLKTLEKEHTAGTMDDADYERVKRDFKNAAVGVMREMDKRKE